MGILPHFRAVGTPGKGRPPTPHQVAERVKPAGGSQLRRGAGTAGVGAPPVCAVPLRCSAAHSPPSLFGPGKTLRTLALRVRGMGSFAFSGLNSLLGSPLCCVGDDEAEWGRGGGTSRSLQIPWGAKTCDLNEWFIDVLLKPLFASLPPLTRISFRPCKSFIEVTFKKRTPSFTPHSSKS